MTDEEPGGDGGDPPVGSGETPTDPSADGQTASPEEGDSATGDGGRPPSDGETPDEHRIDPDAGVVTRFRNSEWLPIVLVRETLSSALIVVVVGVVLFAISGIWPPMVAVESGSMEPHMQKGTWCSSPSPGGSPPTRAAGRRGW
ncbi:MAG: hypothetical protein J07HB67_01898 [halophilic archaeon J07HB67]|jgi:hypothetical protein|nr:MAG: hypothetical protein J07HB67_01898 [halophilic archaeon J07HB67]